MGVVAALAALAGHGLGLPPAVSAGLTLSAAIAVTGALHEDGLADSADGFWGGWSRQRRLEIMRDRRIGSYGVIALILSLGLRRAALTALLATGPATLAILAAAALSRLPMVWLMHLLPGARPDGLSAQTGRPGGATAALATFGALIIGTLTLGPAVFPAALLVIAVAAAAALLMRAKIGGQTGDTLGATQQLSEIALLACLAG